MNLPACIAATCLLAAATAQDPSPEGQALGAAPIKLDGVGDDYRISVALGDLDGDGVEDLVIGRNGSFDVRRGLSRKPRRFAAARSLGVKAGPTCENACEPRLVDVDQDGDLDLLTLCAGEAIGVNAGSTSSSSSASARSCATCRRHTCCATTACGSLRA